jgi:hypothetical protein
MRYVTVIEILTLFTYFVQLNNEKNVKIGVFI